MVWVWLCAACVGMCAALAVLAARCEEAARAYRDDAFRVLEETRRAGGRRPPDEVADAGHVEVPSHDLGGEG